MAERRQIWCWAISAKRYVLYTLGPDGDPVIDRIVDTHDQAAPGEDVVLAKVSEHGLGHLLNPKDPDDASDHWIVEAWLYLLRSALGLRVEEPPWLDRMAVTRVTASSPTVLGWFKNMNDAKPYAEQVKPANFLLLAHPHPLDPSGALPIAPYEGDASRWQSRLTWIDRRNGKPIGTTTDPPDGTPRPGVVHVRTYRQILGDYLAHPEAKSVGPDGAPVGRRTVGLLQRRPVEGIAPPHYIGKEANRLDDRISGLLTRADEYRTEYEDPENGVWQQLVVPVLRTMPRKVLMEESGLSRRSIERILFGGVVPRPSHRNALVGIAVEYARSFAEDIARSTSQHVVTEMLHSHCAAVAAARHW